MFQGLLVTICALFPATPYESGVVGLRLDLPNGASVVSTSSVPPICLITGGNSGNTWNLRLDRGVNHASLTSKELAHQARIRREDPVGTRVLQDRVFQVGDVEGWWLLISQPTGQGTSIFGWLAIPAPGQQYFLARLLTSENGWKYEQNALLHTLSSIVPLDPAELIGKKLQGLNAATEIISGLSKESLHPLIGFQEWRRIQSQPQGASSSNDIGYVYISVVEGYASEIKLDTEKQAAEPEGIVVNIRMRVVPNPETRVVIDTKGQFWLSWDGRESRWWNRITRWIDRSKSIDSETGIRRPATLGSPKSILFVFQEDLMAGRNEPPFKATIKEPWLPRPLVWILGSFFATRDAGEYYEWYMFDNTNELKIVKRTDTLTVGSDGLTTIATRFENSEAVMTTIVDHEGHLIKQHQKGGITLIGSTQREVQTIWEQRGLW